MRTSHRPFPLLVAVGSRVHRTASLFGVFFFFACGGQSTTTDESDVSGDLGTASGGTASSGGNASGGNASGGNASGGNASASGTVPLGDGGLPLFVSVGDSVGSFAVPETDGEAEDDVYAFAVSAEVPLAVLGTHLPHMNFGTQFRTVEFSARADPRTELAVSISPWGVEYSAARAQGIAWQGTRVSVGEEWQDFSIIIGEMTPLTDGEIAPLGTDEGSNVSLILEGPESATVWVSRFALVP